MVTDGNGHITVYQAKCQEFLAWSQPFIYRLLKGLEPHFNQVVVTQRAANQDRFPMPVIETLNKHTLLSPFHVQQAARRLQSTHHGRLIHAHFGYSATKVLLLKMMMRVPMVVTFGGKDLAVHSQRERTLEAYRVMFHCAEQFIAVSDDLRQQAVDSGCPPEKIVTIRRGADTDYFGFVDRTQRPGETVRFLMVSRLVPKKGHRVVIEALASLDPALDWRLDIVGEGPDEAALRHAMREAKIDRRVRFLGSGDSDMVRDAMQAADVLLHPSVTADDGDREGIPNAVVEAQATGLPVIGTHHGGIPEAVVHEETGLLIPEYDAAALTTAIARLLRHPEQRWSMAERARDHVCRHLSLKSQVEDHCAIYRRLIAEYPHDHPSLVHPPVPPELPELLGHSHAEATKAGDLSISEMVEQWFLGPDGNDVAAEPTWYAAFWRLKGHIPPRIKYPVKQVLFWTLSHFIRPPEEPVTEREFWLEMLDKGVPDPVARTPKQVQEVV